METIKRYGMKMCDMTKEATARSILSRSKNVPDRFLDTPVRRKVKSCLRIFGVLFFSMTMMALLGSLVGGLWAKSLPHGEDFFTYTMGGLLWLNLFNVFGMFAELAGDSGGINWFAKGFLVSIVCLGSGFLFFALLRMML